MLMIHADGKGNMAVLDADLIGKYRFFMSNILDLVIVYSLLPCMVELKLFYAPFEEEFF